MEMQELRMMQLMMASGRRVVQQGEQVGRADGERGIQLLSSREEAGMEACRPGRKLARACGHHRQSAQEQLRIS